MTLTPFYPRGNALTESMPLLARDGIGWLAYIEGIPPGPRRWPWRQVILPGRRLRFDSPTESRAAAQVPAGSPFLTDVRLQSLLDEAHVLLPLGPSPSRRPRELTVLRDPVADWVTRAAETIRALVADWSRPWRGAKQQQVLRHRL